MEIIKAKFNYSQLDIKTGEELKRRAARIRDQQKQLAENIWDQGQQLYHAQQELAKNGYGCFQEWAEAETGYSKSTIYRLIQVYENFDRPTVGQSKIATSALYLLAQPSTPEPARQEAVERAEAGETVNRKTAQKIKDRHTETNDNFRPVPKSKSLHDKGKGVYTSTGGSIKQSAPSIDDEFTNSDQNSITLTQTLDSIENLLWAINQAEWSCFPDYGDVAMMIENAESLLVQAGRKI